MKKSQNIDFDFDQEKLDLDLEDQKIVQPKIMNINATAEEITEDVEYQDNTNKEEQLPVIEDKKDETDEQ